MIIGGIVVVNLLPHRLGIFVSPNIVHAFRPQKSLFCCRQILCTCVPHFVDVLFFIRDRR